MNKEIYKSNTKTVLATVVSAAFCASTAVAAPQHDAEFYVLQEQFGEQWLQDDAAIDARLAELEEKHGKKPNVIKILVDDVGYSELGSYGGGKLRGAPTPNLDKMSAEGMRFLQYYSEPASTPTRTALNTGRHNVRVGVNEVIFPGTKGIGLPKEETTIAELFKEAGYNTAMFGKWHLGFGDEYAPTEHGFDEAEWSEGNPAVWGIGQDINAISGHANYGSLERSGIPDKYYDEGGVLRAKAGEKPELVYPYSLEKYDVYEEEVFDKSIEYIERMANDDSPFFLYVGGKANHFLGANPDFMDTPAQTNTSAQMVETDYNLGRLMAALEEQGIADNTLVVWSSDNGPMMGFHPHGGYTMFDKGEKGSTFEGGMRVPAIAWWPDAIEAGQDPLDIFHVTDWYTTFARIAGVYNEIPNDRVVDGVDQTGLLLLGEDKGRRDYLFYYNKGKLEAVRKDWIKIRLDDSMIFVPHYNLMHDPAERYPEETAYAGNSYGMKLVIQEHMKMIQEFPHTEQQPYQRAPDFPFNPTESLEYKAKEAGWEK